LFCRVQQHGIDFVRQSNKHCLAWQPRTIDTWLKEGDGSKRAVLPIMMINSSDYIVSEGRMINEWLVWENVEGSSHGLFQIVILIFARRDRMTTKNLSWHNLYPGWDWCIALPE
jgi:hypothetical protein